jgi:hypothetical protein
MIQTIKTHSGDKLSTSLAAFAGLTFYLSFPLYKEDIYTIYRDESLEIGERMRNILLLLSDELVFFNNQFTTEAIANSKNPVLDGMRIAVQINHAGCIWGSGTCLSPFYLQENDIRLRISTIMKEIAEEPSKTPPQ